MLGIIKGIGKLAWGATKLTAKGVGGLTKYAVKETIDRKKWKAVAREFTKSEEEKKVGVAKKHKIGKNIVINETIDTPYSKRKILLQLFEKYYEKRRWKKSQKKDNKINFTNEKEKIEITLSSLNKKIFLECIKTTEKILSYKELDQLNFKKEIEEIISMANNII